MSDRLMFCMIAFYLLTAGVSFVERQYGRCLYFVGAVVLSIGVLMMRKDLQ